MDQMAEQPTVGEALLGARGPSRSSTNTRRSLPVASHLEEMTWRQAKPIEHELGRDKFHSTIPEPIFEGEQMASDDLITLAQPSKPVHLRHVIPPPNMVKVVSWVTLGF